MPRMSDSPHTLVLLDGDLPGFVALANASEGLSAVQGKPRLAAWPVPPAAGDGDVCWPIIERQAGLYVAQIVRDEPRQLRETDTLLAAGRWAAGAGCRSLLWPAHPGIGGAPDSVDVDRAGEIAERALLVERLVGMEFPGAPAIDPLFADLSDHQIADLVLDLGVPIGLAWWSTSDTPEASTARARWQRAFEGVGYRFQEHAAEPKPTSGRSAPTRRR